MSDSHNMHHPTPEEEARIHEELASHEHGHEHHVHVSPFLPMLTVFILLLILTVVTVLTAKFVHIPGHGNLILALVIASTKASLVAAWFMHLRYDKLINTVVVAASLFGVVLFLGFSMLDISSRDAVNRTLERGEIVEGGTKNIVKDANDRAIIQAEDHAHDDHGDDHADEGGH